MSSSALCTERGLTVDHVICREDGGMGGWGDGGGGEEFLSHSYQPLSYCCNSPQGGKHPISAVTWGLVLTSGILLAVFMVTELR